MKHFTYLHILRQLLTAAGDSIFPPSPEEIAVRSITDSDMISLYQPNTYLNTTYLSEYTNKNIKILITENKFNYNRRAAKLLSKLLTQWLSHQTGSTLLIPVPLGTNRFRERGHNQIQTVTDDTDTSCKTDIIKRTINTPPQSALNKTHRKKNIKNAFCYIESNIDFSQYTQVVLIDDVVTTGSTLNEVRATLAPHLPPSTKLTCLALAH